MRARLRRVRDQRSRAIISLSSLCLPESYSCALGGRRPLIASRIRFKRTQAKYGFPNKFIELL